MLLFKRLKTNVTRTYIVIGLVTIISGILMLNTKWKIIEAQKYILVVNNKGEILPCVQYENRR